MYIDGWSEDLRYATCTSSDNTDGKSKVFRQQSLLQINPSYGVVAPKNAQGAKTVTETNANYPKQSVAVDEEYENLDVSTTSLRERQTSKKLRTTDL